ncbi:MAG: biotin carboxylase N-terminal domain-containing protein [Afipia sp.]|nr:biotin carboxylase N-terminal domain-containing protein [Afipia sp.]
MFKKILVANRGEIACRIARTCRKLGIQVATVHSVADRTALHVREIGESIEIGAAPATESYLVIDRIIEAALRVGADAVHPGYGFLAENGAFAEALAKKGIAFIGPSPEVLRQFGNKASAKQVAKLAGVPVVPGTDRPSASIEEIERAVAGMKLPVLLKAAAGGGGKGMRVVANAATMRADVQAAMREGKSSFGDPSLIVEQFLPDARHIEVQILGDGQGNVVHLFDRECSLQRRHQKVIEEAPVLSLDPALRGSILGHAVRLGERVRYAGLGTVEFIVKDDDAFFLEVNPRIQVEHPVTESVTGLDLVELQIRAVANGALPVAQADVTVSGVAIEARLYAEDADNGFLPSTGTIENLRLTSLVRVDAGISEGMAITSYYDPMIAKLIATAESRTEAYARLDAALLDCTVSGVTTNLSFLRRIASDVEVRANEVHTGTIDAMITSDAEVFRFPLDAHIAAGLWLWSRRNDRIWGGREGLTGWRLGSGAPEPAAAPAIHLVSPGRSYDVTFGHPGRPDALLVSIDGREATFAFHAHDNGQVTVACEDVAITVTPTLSDKFAGFASAVANAGFSVHPYLSGSLLAHAGASDGQVRAPMMGRVVSVNVETGKPVAPGDVLAVMESMKMELTITSPTAGYVTHIDCTVDATVERDQVVFIVSPDVENAA